MPIVIGSMKPLIAPCLTTIWPALSGGMPVKVSVSPLIDCREKSSTRAEPTLDRDLISIILEIWK